MNEVALFSELLITFIQNEICSTRSYIKLIPIKFKNIPGRQNQQTVQSLILQNVYMKEIVLGGSNLLRGDDDSQLHTCMILHRSEEIIS